ncbi:transposable element Tcb2 transposase [Trichonephila clavipes]|nr:transposable element Tcb2 transposase [Trichonephila clavipes]
MSTHITISFKSLLKPGDDTVADSKFLGYVQLEFDFRMTLNYAYVLDMSVYEDYTPTHQLQIVCKGRTEIDMPFRRFRRQYEQLSQFERERIIGINEARWSARQVARQSGRSDCVMRRRWGQWIREMTLTRRSGSRHPQRLVCPADQRILRNARVQPIASSTAI